MTYLEGTQYARLVLAGVLVATIAYQLWVARARRGEPVLYLVAGWAGAALLMVVGRAIQHETVDHATVLLGSKVYHTGVLTLVPIGVALAHEVRGVPRGRLFWLVTAVASIPVPFVWIGHLIISDRVRVFETVVGPILGPDPATLAPVAIPYLIGIAGYLTFVARIGRRQLSWHQRLPLRVTLFLLIPALVNDVLLYSGVLVTLELVGAALFTQFAAINVAVFGRANELFSDLERTVDERTAALRAREEELSRLLAVRRRILDAIPDVVGLLHEGRFDYVNEAGEQFFGKPRTELVGSRLVDYVAADQLGPAEQCLAAIATSPRPTTPVDLRFVGPAGTERSAEVAGLSVDLGDEPRVLVTVRDVTDRKHLLAKLQVADRLASVGTLAAGIAHEINNPLTFVSGNLELLRGALGAGAKSPPDLDPDAVGQCLDDCWMGTQRIAQIVKDLNAFTRATEERSAVDCRAVLDYAIKIARVAIRHRADIALDYGPAPLVNGDSRRLSQVFLNLLVNAFQSIPDDGADHTIRISTRTRSDGWAMVEIADSGVGIDPAMLSSVFDPFVTTKAPGQGTGLGLFICERIVTDLGGEIRLLPNKPSGTIAQVVFPPATIAPPTTTTEDLDSASLAPTAARLLIVDDDVQVLRVLERLLRRYQVTAVADGEQAIRALEAGSFDAILCDLMMPGTNGAEVWSKAKERGMADRFVLMTGGATTGPLRDFVERSKVRCVAKPPSLGTLEHAIETCLGSGLTGAP
ncbi:MAG: ATP-binding protein [Gemmatimonadales bacterium]